MGLNGYADLTATEWKARVGAGGFNSNGGSSSTTADAKGVVLLPETNATSIDWRTKGVVTPVKAEGVCGSCWAMSAIEAIESAYAIATGALRSLSVQQVLECSLNCSAGACGCNGGLPSSAFKYVMSNAGLDSEDDYNYTQIVLPCDTTESKRVVAKIDGYKAVMSYNDSQLLAAVAQQPISVGIDASGKSWQFYSSGVYDNTTDTGAVCDDIQCLDHAVVIVGYGTDNGADYWTVRNSWGPNWGENGYIRMIRHFVDAGGQNSGLDGINVMPTYPTVTKGPPLPLPPPTPQHPSTRPASWCTNCGYDCVELCKESGLKCADQQMTSPVTCDCQDANEPCDQPQK